MTTVATVRCHSCAAPILWASIGDGKRMPLDAEPVIGGNVRLIPPDGGRANALAVITPAGQRDLFDPADDGTRYVSHFVTCPDADEWRDGAA